MRLELLAHIITLSTYCYMYQVELPVALPQLISDIGVNSHQVSITLSGTDIANQPLAFTVPSTTSGLGTLTYSQTVSPSSVVYLYTPAYGFTGFDSFDFTVTNTSGKVSLPGSINMAVVDVAPVVQSRSVNTCANMPMKINLTACTKIAQPVTFALQTAPLYGTISGFPAASCSGHATVTYTPNNNYAGQDSFTFTATNRSMLTSQVATVSIEVVCMPAGMGAAHSSLGTIVAKYAGM